MYSVVFSYCQKILTVLLSFANDFMTYMFSSSTILGDNVTPFDFLLGAFVTIVLVKLVTSFIN